MNHPTKEEWMSYLYNDVPSSTRAALTRHLDSCAECRKSIGEWQTTMQSLDGWRLPHRPVALPFLRPALKWAIAAALAVGLGYGFGRFSAPAANVATLRVGIENSLRASLESEIETRLQQKLQRQLTVMTANMEAGLIERMNTLATASDDQTHGVLAAYDNAIKGLDTRLNQQGTEISALRKDTETMAVLTEVGFRRNEQQLVRLASFNDSQGQSRNNEHE